MCARKEEKYMEAALQQNYQTGRYHSLDEFADRLGNKLARHYGVIELRESERLIEPDWKEQPMRSWSEVYDELCCEVGQVYGLSDIREA